MKKLTLIAILAIGATATLFTACSKEPQENTKQATTNPLKDIPEGTTYTFYGQTEKNLANEEICRMQLTMGKNGEWTVNREIIPNRMLKSTIELSSLVALHVPDEYISYPDESSIKFTFPEDSEVKYHFLPFEINSKKAIGIGDDEYEWKCGCIISRQPMVFGLCEESSNRPRKGVLTSLCLDPNKKCEKKNGICDFGYVKKGEASISYEVSDPGILFPGSYIFP